MVDRDVVGQWQTGRIEDAGLGAKVLEQARGLLYQQATERALAGRSVEQQDAWFVLARGGGWQAFEQGWIKIGQVV
ncbi:hypothetical protein SRM1_03167 [Pseudomonas fluorescens]|nr:hypothetical protein SRM1_03167 [Pseudomonas fluorescens]